MVWRRAQRSTAMEVVATITLVAALAGCGTEATLTTSTTTSVPQPTTSQPPDTTTVTSAVVGPQPLPSSGFAEPGEYVTTRFEPTVAYRIGTRRILRPLDNEKITGFQNRFPRGDAEFQGFDPYRGVVVHNHWLGLTPEELAAELAEIEALSLGSTSPVEIGGLQGTQIEATLGAKAILWSESFHPSVDPQLSYWDLEARQVMRLIVVETPAGSLLITIGADAEEWDQFLPVANEILAEISFPELG